MKKQKPQQKDQKHTPTSKKLKNKVGNNMIIFALQRGKLLRICVYDETRPSQIYEEIYYGDILPNEAKSMFRSVEQMFEFLELNFESLVTLKEKQSIVVDLNKIKIPIRFELPIRLEVYPVVNDVLESFNRQNQELKGELEQTVRAMRNNEQKHEQSLKQLKRQVEESNKETDYFRYAKKQLTNEVFKLETQLQQEKRKNQQLQTENKSLHWRLEKSQLSNKLLEEKIQQRSKVDSLQKVEQQIKGPYDQLIKQLQEVPPVKKSNPFLSGLFSKRILTSSNPLLNQSLSKKVQNGSLLPEAGSEESRFHRFIEFENNGQMNLIMSKRMIRDSDIDELIQFDWSNVSRFNLSENIVTGKGLQKLFETQWDCLKSLIISSNKITDFDLTKINFQKAAPNLLLIDLNFNSLSKEMFKKLIEFSRNYKQPKIYFNGVRPHGQSMMNSSKTEVR